MTNEVTLSKLPSKEEMQKLAPVLRRLHEYDKNDKKNNMTKRTKYQHILKEDVTLDAAPFSTIPKGTPIFGEEQNGFVIFQFGEYKRQISKTMFR